VGDDTDECEMRSRFVIQIPGNSRILKSVATWNGALGVIVLRYLRDFQSYDHAGIAVQLPRDAQSTEFR